jgi:hypothetical protein
MDEPRYYVRIRGVVSGPFDNGQLQTMRRMGRLARFHEISPDRQTWVAASTLAGLFPLAPPPAGQATRRNPSAAQPSPAVNTTPAPAFKPAPGPAVWYYDSGEDTVGPIALEELHRLIAQGIVNQKTLVWTEGMPGWLPFHDAATQGLTSPALPVVIDTAHEGFNPTPQGGSYGSAPASVEPPRPHPGNAPTSGLAIASLLLGLTGWTCGIGSLLALVLGTIAVGRINNSQGRLEGKSIAITGLVLGAVGITTDVALALVIFVM